MTVEITKDGVTTRLNSLYDRHIELTRELNRYKEKDDKENIARIEYELMQTRKYIASAQDLLKTMGCWI